MTGSPARESLAVAREITFDAKREPMFWDEQGNGWAPLARFHELWDALERIASCDCQVACGSLPFAARCPGCIAREALGRPL